MKIERVVFIFEKDEDKLIAKLTAKNLDSDVLKRLFTLKEGDPEFYSPNKIEKKQYDAIINYIPELENYPCEKFELYLEAVSV